MWVLSIFSRWSILQKTHNFLRSIAANAPGIGPFQSPKSPLQRPGLSQSARLQVVINLWAARQPCTTFISDLPWALILRALVCILVLWPFSFLIPSIPKMHWTGRRFFNDLYPIQLRFIQSFLDFYMALRPRAFGSSSIHHLTQSIMEYIAQWVSILQEHL